MRYGSGVGGLCSESRVLGGDVSGRLWQYPVAASGMPELVSTWIRWRPVRHAAAREGLQAFQRVTMQPGNSLKPPRQVGGRAEACPGCGVAVE